MSTITRHPSSPRKTPPPPTRPALVIPVVVCAACKDPVVPTVRPGPSPLVVIVLFFMAIIPAILYLILFELQKRRAVTCPQCNGVDLVPLDSTRGREILGNRFDAVLADGRKLAIEVRRLEAEAKERESRAWLIGLGIIVLAGVVLVVAGWWYTRDPNRLPSSEDSAAAVLAEAARTREAAESDRADRAERPAPGPVELVDSTTEIVITAEGIANLTPSATGEPTRKLHAGDVYQRGEERDGWIRLVGTPTEAWAPASITKPRRVEARR